MSTAEPRLGQLSVALATLIYLLNDAGHRPADEEILAACTAIAEAPEDADMDAFGQALVDRIEAALGGEEPGDVLAFLGGLFGSERLVTDFGADREERSRSMRRYHFTHHLPWLARIIDRFPDGSVGPHWVLVERVGQSVTCADPYPWDDLDEEYDLPLTDFHVKWELAGGCGVRFE